MVSPLLPATRRLPMKWVLIRLRYLPDGLNIQAKVYSSVRGL